MVRVTCVQRTGPKQSSSLSFRSSLGIAALPHPVGVLSGGFADAETCQQVWEKTWNAWPGKAPPDMSPVDSLSELKSCLESFPAEYDPVPLDEPSAGLHSLATRQLLLKLDSMGLTPDSERVSR